MLFFLIHLDVSIAFEYVSFEIFSRVIQHSTNFKINGQIINVKDDNSIKEVASIINTTNVGVVATATDTD